MWGLAEGGASIFAKAILNLLGDFGRFVWLADSFEGMPVQKEQDKVDFALAGNEFLAVSLEGVQENFRRFGLLDDNIKFLKGWFCDTLHKVPINNIAVLRLDGDYYSSPMDILDVLYDKVSIGGYIIVDDYEAFASCRNAIQEFLAARRIAPEVIPSTGRACIGGRNKSIASPRIVVFQRDLPAQYGLRVLTVSSLADSRFTLPFERNVPYFALTGPKQPNAPVGS